MKTKLFIKHRKDCVALQACKRGDWETPWFLDDSPINYELSIWADSLCRKNRGTYHRWIALRCNDPDCPAMMRIGSQEIEVMAQKLLKDANP